MFVDFGIDLKIRLLTDASAAKSIALRIGLGKIRPLETSQLWLQGNVADGTISVRKFDGKDNNAVALNKHFSGPELSRHVEMLPIIRTNKVHEQSLQTNL